jgi:hypothetical protein
MPMLRAVPSMVFIAASTVLQLRSGSLMVAISRTWSFVTLPTFLRLGSPEPDATPAAFLRSTDAGGVFRMKVKLRSCE